MQTYQIGITYIYYGVNSNFILITGLFLIYSYNQIVNSWCFRRQFANTVLHQCPTVFMNASRSVNINARQSFYLTPRSVYLHSSHTVSRCRTCITTHELLYYADTVSACGHCRSFFSFCFNWVTHIPKCYPSTKQTQGRSRETRAIDANPLL